MLTEPTGWNKKSCYIRETRKGHNGYDHIIVDMYVLIPYKYGDDRKDINTDCPYG